MAGTLSYQGMQASIGPSGKWTSEDSGLANRLNKDFAPVSTVVGVPYVMAFHAAVGCLPGARVVVEPKAEDGEGRIH